MVLCSQVAIPRSGLGTFQGATVILTALASIWAVRKVIKLMSPSHPVGVECQVPVRVYPNPADFISPSHAVGFKTYKLVKGLVETLLRESPSHAVGSEQGSRVEPRPSLPKSPSHAVGLEPSRRRQSISLPSLKGEHGRHPTQWARNRSCVIVAKT